MNPVSSSPAASLLLFFLGTSAVVSAEPRVTAQLDDAFVTKDENAAEWSIGNEAMVYAVGLADGKTFGVRRIASTGGMDWDSDGATDASFTAGGKPVSFGAPANGFTFRSSSVEEVDGGLRLAVEFTLNEPALRVTRYYVVHPHAPGIETWLQFESTAGSVDLGDIGVWQQGLAAANIRWVTGLLAPASEGGPFTRRYQPLLAGEVVTLGSKRRSSEQAVPIAWLEGSHGQLATGLLWSGEWTITLSRPRTRAQVRASLGEMSTTVRAGAPLETPRAFVVVTQGGTSEATIGLRQFVDAGLRSGRPFPARVTYNTWFSYGIQIDESSMLDEMAYAADFGADLFVLDAGWYPGGTRVDDFHTGLGTWQIDTRRFPRGIGVLADQAHELGLQFGIWVEPERVALSTINKPGLAREQWLATSNGRYDPGLSNSSVGAAQICLVDSDARAWVLQHLFALIDAVRPDYLKWDNNYWVNCTRTEHGHGTKDGNFAHVKALYEIFAALRERYPDLVIENCSGGGNRLDLGMMRYTDVAWMDDRSAPSSRVRHNLEGLTAVFPGSYLLGFVMDDQSEPIHEAVDHPLTFRSRMPGILGLSYRAGEFGEADVEQMKSEIAVYKGVRTMLQDATTLLITSQVREGSTDTWDAIESVSSSTGDVVLFGFQGPGAPEQQNLRLQALDRDSRYTIIDRQAGFLGSASGADLMDEGLDVDWSSVSAAHLLVLMRTSARPVD